MSSNSSTINFRVASFFDSVDYNTGIGIFASDKYELRNRYRVTEIVKIVKFVKIGLLIFLCSSNYFHGSFTALSDFFYCSITLLFQRSLYLPNFLQDFFSLPCAPPAS